MTIMRSVGGHKPESQDFEIAIPDEAIADLRQRLRQTRFPDDFANDWSYGITGTYLRELVDYWVEEYDWREHERAMNRYQHRLVVLDEVPVHYMRVRGRGQRVVPLILTHGWPWSFWDFAQVIGPLSDPAAHGLHDAIAFDLVVPSLPGYGFSSPLRKTGVNLAKVADLWARLMTEVLGYERFAAHGGDWGAFVTAHLAHAHADKLIGAHQTFPAVVGVANIMELAGPDDYGPDEAGWYESWRSRMATTLPHAMVHRSFPQTVAVAFNDSPAGLAAWIIDRRRLWSDCGGDVESVFSRDFLLTLVSIYWYTETYHTMARLYSENARMPWAPRHNRQPPAEAPTAVAVFPRELLLLPRGLMERHANIARWTIMPRGGHFAAAEQPGLVVDDIRAFFDDLTGGGHASPE
jgi:pimeloyl-ACP methyl ester carboxylesterase